MEDEISNDINTLVIVAEQWTKLEQTVWKRHLVNTRLALDKSRQCADMTNPRLSTELELTVWKRRLANTRLAD